MDLSNLKARAASVAENVLRPAAEEVDRSGHWPETGIRALADAGLTALHVPERLGGHGQGLAALAQITEILGRACGSTAMCFGMHCVGTAVIAAKATPEQDECFLRPIARGEHITTLALSEPGTGSHFYLPRTSFRPDGDSFALEGCKSFITNGGHADSYVVSAAPPGDDLDPGTFTCILMERGASGLEWGPLWNGVGMRGNSSRSATLRGVRVPRRNLLGQEGDQLWYVFEVVAPSFLAAMSGTYLGIAQAALDLAGEHVKAHSHTHTFARLVDSPVIAEQFAEMWTSVERARQLLAFAARTGDAGGGQAAQAIFSAKLEVSEVATAVTTRTLTLLGGRGYREGAEISRLIRDAQAAHIMAPTSQMLKAWLGRMVLGLPPL